jgi:signal transduction histidine kinase
MEEQPNHRRKNSGAASGRNGLPRWSSLRVRLMALVGLAVFPALLLVIYNAFAQRRAGLETARQEAYRLVRMAAVRQDQLITEARQLLVTLAQLNEVKTIDGRSCQTLFKNLLRLYTIYANIGAVRPDGTVFASGVPLTADGNLSDRSYFQDATNRLDFAIGQYQVGKANGRASLNLAYPVLDESGRLAAVVYAVLDLDWMYQMHADAQLPPGSSFTVFDRDYVTLARYPDPDRKFVGQLIFTNRPPPRLPPPEAEAPPRPRDHFSILTGRDGVKRLYASTLLGEKLAPHNGVRVAVGIPVAVAFAAADQMLFRNILFLGLVAFLAMMAAWFGSDMVVLRRIRTLVDAAERLQTGDLSARIGPVPGEGELEQLARNFDRMAAALERQFAERSRAETALKALNEELEQRVTERTRELKRSNEALEQFAYVASHDLQEPLRMVTSYLNLLEQRYGHHFDSDAREFIGFAVDGAGRMHRLIADLLSFSRVQTKARHFEPVNCQEVVERVLDNLKMAIAESQARIAHDSLPVVAGDPSLLSQLFQNLIGNAVKFRAEARPEIRLEAQRNGDQWKFSVRDNGIGIDPRHFDRIFMIFQRLHGRDKYPGTGIGLSLCKKIVERHGGRIWLESEPGRGTTFFFTLPAANPNQEVPA